MIHLQMDHPQKREIFFMRFLFLYGEKNQHFFKVVLCVCFLSGSRPKKNDSMNRCTQLDSDCFKWCFPLHFFFEEWWVESTFSIGFLRWILWMESYAWSWKSSGKLSRLKSVIAWVTLCDPKLSGIFWNVCLSHDLLALTGSQDMSKKKTHVKIWNHAMNFLKERGTKFPVPQNVRQKVHVLRSLVTSILMMLRGLTRSLCWKSRVVRSSNSFGSWSIVFGEPSGTHQFGYPFFVKKIGSVILNKTQQVVFPICPQKS